MDLAARHYDPILLRTKQSRSRLGDAVNSRISTLRRTLCAVSLLASAGACLAATPTRHEVLVAISVLERNVTGQEAVDAAKTIVVYAQDSEDVVVDIGPGQLPWVSEKWGLAKEQELEYQSMLLAAYVAGNIKSQIKNARVEDDTYSGWVFAIDAYKRLRAKEPFRSASIDDLAKKETDGTLLRHAKEIQKQDEQQDEPEQRQHEPLARNRPGLEGSPFLEWCLV
jgi:hypothetical protein